MADNPITQTDFDKLSDDEKKRIIKEQIDKYGIQHKSNEPDYDVDKVVKETEKEQKKPGIIEKVSGFVSKKKTEYDKNQETKRKEKVYKEEKKSVDLKERIKEEKLEHENRQLQEQEKQYKKEKFDSSIPGKAIHAVQSFNTERKGARYSYQPSAGYPSHTQPQNSQLRDLIMRPSSPNLNQSQNSPLRAMLFQPSSFNPGRQGSNSSPLSKLVGSPRMTSARGGQANRPSSRLAHMMGGLFSSKKKKGLF